MCRQKSFCIREVLCMIICVSPIPCFTVKLECGERSVHIDLKIDSGRSTEIEYWPWHAAIYGSTNYNSTYICGGTIIDVNTILTSAHCLYTSLGLMSAAEITVYLGNLLPGNITNISEMYKVAKLIPHPDFQPGGLAHDIALIQLDTNIKMDYYRNSICLWNMDAGQESIVGRTGTIVGFGQNDDTEKTNQLKEAPVEVVDFWTCIDSDRQIYGLVLTPGMFCARGDINVSACRGDSGGGILFQDDERWFIRGIISFVPSPDNGLTCDVSKYTVFTDVAWYHGWIAKYVNQSVLSVRSEYLVSNSTRLRLVNPAGCGVSTYSGDNGSDFLDYPWIGLVQSDLPENQPWVRCQVTLINEWYAVGPANCFVGHHQQHTILIGKQCTFDCNVHIGSSYCAQRCRIATITFHPLYNATRYTHDLALIELAEPVDFTKTNAVPICLPTMAGLRSYNGTVMAYASFKRDLESFVARNSSYINNTLCQDLYLAGRFRLKVGKTRFCADRNRENILPGAPIQTVHTFSGRRRHFLRGYGLFGLRGEKNYPAVFVNINSYLGWILYNMKNKTLEHN